MNALEGERIVMSHLIEAWEVFKSLPPEHSDELAEFRFSIHRLQDILAFRIARRDHPDIFL